MIGKDDSYLQHEIKCRHLPPQPYYLVSDYLVSDYLVLDYLVLDYLVSDYLVSDYLGLFN